MGMFQQMKDMKDTINAAPVMVGQAQQLSAQAQEMAAAQQTAFQPQAAQFGWDAAAQGWNERNRRNRAVARRFNHVYRGI